MQGRNLRGWEQVLRGHCYSGDTTAVPFDARRSIIPSNPQRRDWTVTGTAHYLA